MTKVVRVIAGVMTEVDVAGPGATLASRSQVTRANRDINDLIRIEDVSDTTDGAMTTKKILLGDVTLINTARQTTAGYTNSTTTSSDIVGLTLPVLSGRAYKLEVVGIFRTAATTTGLGLNFTGPAVTYMSWTGKIQLAAAGSDQFYEGTVVTAAAAMATTKVVSTGVIAATTDYQFTITGLIIPSANGTLQLQGSSEVAASAITIQHSIMTLIDCG